MISAFYVRYNQTELYSHLTLVLLVQDLFTLCIKYRNISEL